MNCVYIGLFLSHTIVRGNLGFSVLLKDTSKCRLEVMGIEPATLLLVDNPLSPESEFK